jgi:hypothetical protein
MKIAFIILPLFLFVACNKPSKSTSIDQSINQNDTIVTKTYWSDKKERLAQIEKVWKIDTLFVQDTTSKEIYPMPFRHGEIHIFDSAGHKVSNNKIQLELSPHYIILGKISFKSDSILPFNMP